MNAILSPLVSEFETQEQATSYVAWLTAKVQCRRVWMIRATVSRMIK